MLADDDALTICNDELIAGGELTTTGGTPANRIARWDGTSWSALGSGMSASDDPHVGALIVHNGQLIAGGTFTVAGDHVSSHWAHWGTVAGDCDCDVDVDLRDFADFEVAFTGPLP